MKVLISGAGIAGLSLALRLRQRGMTPVVVERSPRLRDGGGYMLGFSDPGLDAAERLGVADALRAARHMPRRLVGPASPDAMLDAIPVEGPHWLFRDPGYGLGLMIDRSRPAGRLAGHGGEGPGYSAGALCFAPGHGPRVTAVALANTESHDLGLRLAWGLIAASTASP